MTDVADDTLTTLIRSVVREEIRAFHRERADRPSDAEIKAIGLALTSRGLKAVSEPIPVEVDNVVPLRCRAKPEHPPPSPPPSAA